LFKSANLRNVFPPPIHLFVNRTALLQNRIDRKFIESLPFEFVMSTDQQWTTTTQAVQFGQRNLGGSLDIVSVARCQCIKVSYAAWTARSYPIFVGYFTKLACYLALENLCDKWPFAYAGREGFHNSNNTIWC